MLPLASARAGIKNEILWQLLAFCRLLKNLGVDLSMNRVIDAVRSLSLIDVSRKTDFYYALRANLVSTRDDLPIFDLAFEMFWRNREETEDETNPPDDQQSSSGKGQGNEGNDGLERRVRQVFIEEFGQEEKDEEDPEEQPIASFSPSEMLATKDFSYYDDSDVKDLKALLARLAPKMATRLSRRTMANPRGHDIDPRRTLRKNIKYGGIVVELPRRKRKITKTKLVLICDVSGSMDSYSKFLIQFVYAFQSQIRGVEAFVFSTRLTRVTNMLHTRDIYEALNRMSDTVRDWSGGTNIGNCLRDFNNGPGRSILSSRTIVVIISDGWDRGDSEALAVEMDRLRSRSYKVIWMNPLAGSPSYQPICSGMKAALPYVDHFFPAHNLNALLTLSKVLGSLAKKK
jgi:uncharacterized protein with von Willebrand factor type A (vWA) domain